MSASLANLSPSSAASLVCGLFADPRDLNDATQRLRSEGFRATDIETLSQRSRGSAGEVLLTAHCDSRASEAKAREILEYFGAAMVSTVHAVSGEWRPDTTKRPT